MGNALKVGQDFAGTTMIQDEDSESVLLDQLSELSEVELCRVHWCLSQNPLQDFPPIPQRWLRSADAFSTTKTMMWCYEEEGALTVLHAVLTQLGLEAQVLHVHHKNPPRPRPVPKLAPNFVRTFRRRLISRIQKLDAVLDTLQKEGILNAANREALSIYALSKDKNRALVDLVLRKGQEAQEKFCQALSQSEPFMLQELQNDPIRNKNSPETPDFMLECLVSDELRCFQWLAKNHMIPESQSQIGVNPLKDADRQMTQGLLEKEVGLEQAASITEKIVLKIVPALRACLPEDEVMSQNSPDIGMNTHAPVVEITPEVHEDNSMFRLHCSRPGAFRCSLTGLVLEGSGDVVYSTVPWDVDFLSRKGLRPAGPLFRFTLLTGSFHRLHLPHCQVLPGRHQHFLSVAHITGDSMDVISAGHVTISHVIVDITSFSCFGLTTAAGSGGAISGLVLLFSPPTNSSIFVLLLPRNICLLQVRKEWRRRIAAEYVEAIPDCQLIPNQTYQMTGDPITVIQPKTSKFENFTDYNNFLPSFEVKLPADVTTLSLQLRSIVAPSRLLGWLFSPTYCEVWTRVVHLRGDCRGLASASVDVTQQLFHIMTHLTSEELKIFQHFLTLSTNPIPISRLEAADRTRTVTLMVQQYHPEGAKLVTEEILRKMKHNQLADDLERN